MFTWVEVDTKAIKHNITAFRKLIGKDRLLMPVVKANAYGHGMVEIAKICDKSKDVDRICVVSGGEAITLLENRIKKPIQILSFYDLDKSLTKLIGKNIIFPVYNSEQINYLQKIGERLKKKIKIHLKLDTGASRTGILIKDLADFIKKINKSNHLELEGLMSHFASSEENEEYTRQQIKTFEKATQLIEEKGTNLKIRHMACSAASTLYPTSLFNGMRLGLSLYGLYPAKEVTKIIKLKPALSWRTKIIQVKTLPAGSKIGYGGTYTVPNEQTIAILPIGYWDGLDRSLSNTGEVLVEGIHCPIRGRICMNLTMVDVSKIKNPKTGLVATIIGKSGGEILTAEDIAEKINTINYEVVDRINPLIPRIYR